MATDEKKKKKKKDGEEEKSALITVGDPPPEPQAWDFTVYDHDQPTNQPDIARATNHGNHMTMTNQPWQGHIVDNEGTNLYITGETGMGAGIIIVSDYWGWNSGRVREIADHLAKSASAIVAIPQLLNEPPLLGGTDGDGASADFDPDDDELADTLRTWLMKYLWETFEPKMKSTAQYLRTAGAKPGAKNGATAFALGGVGFGWGSWIMCYTSEMCQDMVGIALVNPLAAFIEEMYGGDVEAMASRCKCPAVLMVSSSCPDTYKPGGTFFEALKVKQTETRCLQFPNMLHGWVNRGKPDVANGICEAVISIQKFLRNKMWPLPIGADADTLRKACQDGDADMIEELIKLKLPVGGEESHDMGGMCPIHYAARFGQAQPIDLLVEASADVNAQGGAMNESALHCAARNGRMKAAARLVSLHANVNVIDKCDQTPLHHAALKGHTGVCTVLVRGNANIEAADTTGQTALHLAAWQGNDPIVQYFIKERADIEMEDKRGQTPYMRAVQGGCTQSADTLDFERQRREQEKFEAAQKAAAEAAEAARQAKKDALQPGIAGQGSTRSLFGLLGGGGDD